MSDEYCKHGSRIYCVQCSNNAPLAALRDELARVKGQLGESLHELGLMQSQRDAAESQIAGVSRISDSEMMSLLRRRARYADDLEAKLAAAVAERDELKERNDRQAETLKLVGPYPHMCRMDHIQIGFAGEYREGDERCPVCILESERDELRRSLGEAVEALRKAREFIVNGVEYGYIRMPDADKPDAAHKMLPMIDALVARHDTGEGSK